MKSTQATKPKRVAPVSRARPPRWVPAAVRVNTSVRYTGVEIAMSIDSRGAWVICCNAADARRMAQLSALAQWDRTEQQEEERKAIVARGQEWLDANSHDEGKSWRRQYDIECERTKSAMAAHVGGSSDAIVI